jgi:hypothetical protein
MPIAMDPFRMHAEGEQEANCERSGRRHRAIALDRPDGITEIRTGRELREQNIQLVLDRRPLGIV